MNLGVVNDAGGDDVRIARFQVQVRLTFDHEIGFTLQHVAGLDAGMGVPPGGSAGAISAMPVTVV